MATNSVSQRERGGGFPVDEEVRAARLAAAFEEISRKVRPRDVFIFFLSGHGKTVDGHYYFVPQDFRYQGEQSFAEQGIGQEKLQSWLAKITARKSILLFDSCESGTLTADRVATRGLEQAAAVEPTGTRQAADQAEPYRVRRQHDDGDGLGSILGRQRCGGAHRHQDIHFETDKLGH